ncbi:DnaJ domain-containing protein [Rathayibacter toxicus]|uniref:Heat-shock protein n=1 Tax=Rathayibacter toxicus TaxID=145458 RepID=A0A2S5Y6J8_9MICO|nr:DnaJ domain-containing protein [Rathayibacter toxicus]PPH23572.1 heat-shock protein [Rathayibacter toxicus]PPH57377.1 heat-shock protein [Rathayibacter toxicus]PPH59877.1 heat-shock protein [Rathayibacter toxicus]PPH87332.1 heat-shock protein [Rathayibacter toxicus]PPI15100.1 heat-shock protein [Rathayibacter toxicus]
MSDSHAARTPYEVLGVAATASDDELRRVYRRLLRETHPDTGGDAESFHAVQRAWERVGSASARRDYDRGAPAPRSAPETRSGSPRASSASTVRARSYGHPGGAAREYYLSLVREWLGRGEESDDPFDEAVVRSAPREIRVWLAKAQAEETTAVMIGELGLAYTVWNDVAVGDGRTKIDHVVLGPSGLMALSSADWGEPVRLRRGELEGSGLSEHERPIASVVRAARRLGRELGVQFSASGVVVPDDALEQPFEWVQRGRHRGALVIRRSLLPQLLRSGNAAAHLSDYADPFVVRARIQNRVRFV